MAESPENQAIQIDPAVAATIPRLDPAPTAEQVDAFRRAGVGVVRGLIDTDEVDRLRDAFMRAAADGPIEGLSESTDTDSPDPLKRYPRMLHPHRHDDREVGQLARRYMLDPRLIRVLRGVMQDEPLAAQSMFYFKPPGARGQGLHQDNHPLAVKPGTCVAAWMPLDTCDAENGALQVVPGTGPMDLLCNAENESRSDIFFNRHSIKLPDGVEPVTADLQPGDVLLFNGQVIHGSYPNRTSDRWRRTLIFHYAPESCEQIADFYLPLLDTAGQPVQRRASKMGGLCGEFVDQPEG